MSANYKWVNKIDKESQYIVVFFTSRNKDNKDIEGFKERKYAFLCQNNPDSIKEQFDLFVSHGVKGELSRYYVSLNTRDTSKIRKELIYYLIEHEDFNIDYFNAKIVSIAAKKENALTKKWFFDFDLDCFKAVTDFMTDIAIYTDVETYAKKTPHGYAVIVERGFDTRELLKKWGEVATLKRDDLICIDWRTKL